MSTHAKRIATIQALIAGSIVTGAAEYPVISAEFSQVPILGRLRNKARRRLLQVLHSTRAVDTALKCFLLHHGCTPGTSINRHLAELTKHNAASISQLSKSEHARYRVSIANPRNRYMHVAGAHPVDDAEVATLLGEMDACLARVLAL